MGEALREIWVGLSCVGGSFTFPSHAQLNHAGSVAVKVLLDGSFAGGMCGCAPGPVQEIGYAELRAVLRVLREK